ncbi:phosphonate ABC transporter, permease protein PhnE [Wenzhouxiangella sp. XN201]|uniref:phosphonate ABC transporter, permease protein PhnE n=1 Tax=Wenzhouxiangella sp. XN201 TaxID=2710755 RepID=UPI0013CA3318|nr:phosphonate ABC transporter, permease protein PhnE [Wenzhouxiangella sp. XN201]NEZ03161.1 phosphonate ABC transporter, permease protein PhnE [Wenzhouxiangella sp. XN201]
MSQTTLQGRNRVGGATWATFIIAALFFWSMWAIGFSPDRLGKLPAQMVEVLGFFWPADMAYGWDRVMPAIAESIQIAWIGTIIGALFSLPLALLGARTLFPKLARGVKLISAITRAFPEILLAIYFVPIVGLGPFGGALAIGISSIGMLTKLGAEVVDSLDHGPIEAVEAAGGSRILALRFAVLPQVLPEIIAHWLFRFELNIRASAVLGVVGAGGVGGVLLNTLRYRHFDKAAAVLVLTILIVLVIDMVSGEIRRRIIRG